MSNTDPSQFQRIADYKRSWSNNPFLNAQGLEVEEIGTGEVVVRLPQVLPSQRGGGGTDHALNGGVVSYMFDGALRLGNHLLAAGDARSAGDRSRSSCASSPSTSTLPTSKPRWATASRPTARWCAVEPQHGLRRGPFLRCQWQALRHRQGHLARVLAAQRHPRSKPDSFHYNNRRYTCNPKPFALVAPQASGATPSSQPPNWFSMAPLMFWCSTTWPKSPCRCSAAPRPRTRHWVMRQISSPPFSP